MMTAYIDRMKGKTFKKVDFMAYEGKYDNSIRELMTKAPNSIDVETMRAHLYGFTFTPEYAMMDFPDELSMDYWSDRFEEGVSELKRAGVCTIFEKRQEGDSVPVMTSFYDVVMPQEELILRTIDSTGNGLTPETALCVINVCQEYEYMRRVMPFSKLQMVKQTICNGIDCISFAHNIYGVEKLYFDIHRRFIS